MKEYFILARTFAAPFISETIEKFVKADSPEDALLKFIASKPAGELGIYAANVYADANAERKGEKYLAQWLCNHEIAKRKVQPDGSYYYLGHGPGDFEIDGKRHTVKNPKEGSICHS